MGSGGDGWQGGMEADAMELYVDDDGAGVVDEGGKEGLKGQFERLCRRLREAEDGA
jgi:hypothetical protein